ncbi:MAG: Uncharacterized protein G01um101425_650 [Candidatus Peregrinibacteria bacterium Gr01-1014_25]|nr:MAG: Uncharacterized protein G01um101425_650 [Candidatus Peregrinibacteria bacterium Gr01-1014_25]
MQTYERFVFEAYRFDAKSARIEMDYVLEGAGDGSGDVRFTETLQLPRQGLKSRGIPRQLLHRALFALHLIGGVSYYKTCLPRSIVIRSGALTEDQARFWTEVYENGLGEFFYRNDIDFTGLIRFPATAAETPEPMHVKRDTQTVLCPIGGGKDSVVTIELLKSAGVPAVLLRMNAHPLITQAARTAGLPLLGIKRTMAPELFSLNEQGALNGHVPITAYLHFLGLVAAFLYGHGAVVFSNERSANVGSLMFHGREINHQWSKSLTFERLFQEYVGRFITPDILAFSLLRPLSELAIVQRFATHPQYFTCTTSCNTNWKLKTQSSRLKAGAIPWCGQCSKCAFAFAMLAAFLSAEQAASIVGSNLFESETLLPTYRQLLGIEGVKPFDCVGTPEETRAAFCLAHKRGDMEGSAAMRMFVAEALPDITDPDALVRACLVPNPDHAIPPDYSTILA